MLSRIAFAFLLALVGPASGKRHANDVEITSNELSKPLGRSVPTNDLLPGNIRVFYHSGVSEDTLPTCSPNMMCNKLDTYSTPWIEKQCKCPGNNECSTSLHARDGHTIVDRNKQYKTCSPVRKLHRCKYFHELTWTHIVRPNNSSKQVIHCRCPKGSSAYLLKRHAFETGDGTESHFGFACSPPTKLKCQHKEPCKLFSVRKNPDRPMADEVTTNSLCKCPHKRKCPKHHLDIGVIPGRLYSTDNVKTFTGYCM